MPFPVMGAIGLIGLLGFSGPAGASRIVLTGVSLASWLLETTLNGAANALPFAYKLTMGD